MKTTIEHTKGLGVNHFAAFVGTLYVGTFATEREALEASQDIIASFQRAESGHAQ